MHLNIHLKYKKTDLNRNSWTTRYPWSPDRVQVIPWENLLSSDYLFWLAFWETVVFFKFKMIEKKSNYYFRNRKSTCQIHFIICRVFIIFSLSLHSEKVFWKCILKIDLNGKCSSDNGGFQTYFTNIFNFGSGNITQVATTGAVGMKIWVQGLFHISLNSTKNRKIIAIRNRNRQWMGRCVTHIQISQIRGGTTESH